MSLPTLFQQSVIDATMKNTKNYDRMLKRDATMSNCRRKSVDSVPVNGSFGRQSGAAEFVRIRRDRYQSMNCHEFEFKSRSPYRPNRLQGFTLVELIGTSLLMGMLFSIMIPMFVVVARERRSTQQRQSALQHATNLVERATGAIGPSCFRENCLFLTRMRICLWSYQAWNSI